MLNVKYMEKNYPQQNDRFNEEYTKITLIQNEKSNIEYMRQQKSLLKNRANKFLSIPERQRIIREINESNNQIDLQINLYNNLEKEKKEKMKSEKNNKILYIKKTKSNLNLLRNAPVKSSNKSKRNTKIDVKFTDNREFMNNAIKEYYKKIYHSFKSYLHVLNNKSNDSKIINSKNSFNKSFNNNKNIKKNGYNSNKNIFYKNNDNINSFNEIYKKPNVGKYNKIINTKENINNTNTNKINKINKINYIDLDKLCMISSTRKKKK